jgi:AbrB family looped-hinge helix DNA binding protein
MPVTTVTSKGQITIPARVRKKLGLEQGSKVSFEPFEETFILRSMETDPLDGLEGFFEYSGAAHTIEEMHDAVRQRAAKGFGNGR